MESPSGNKSEDSEKGVDCMTKPFRSPDFPKIFRDLQREKKISDFNTSVIQMMAWYKGRMFRSRSTGKVRLQGAYGTNLPMLPSSLTCMIKRNCLVHDRYNGCTGEDEYVLSYFVTQYLNRYEKNSSKKTEESGAAY